MNRPKTIQAIQSLLAARLWIEHDEALAAAPAFTAGSGHKSAKTPDMWMPFCVHRSDSATTATMKAAANRGLRVRSFLKN
jgi:hypothetical protein